MSLAVRSIRRAHACASPAIGLSLSSSGLRRVQPLPQRLQHIRWISTEPAEPKDPVEVSEPSEPNGIVRRVPAKEPAGLTLESKKSSKVISASPSALRRSVLRRVVKQRAGTKSSNPVLVKEAQWYPNKHEVVRSERKSYRSKARQDLWAHARAIEEKRAVDWRGVVNFLTKLTPNFGSIFTFKVVVSKGAAEEVRSLLPKGPAATPGHLQQSTRAIVRVDGLNHADGTLGLTLTGSAHSVRLALLDLVKASGHISAVRVLDSNSEGMLRDLWQEQEGDLDSVKLVGMTEKNAADKMLTLRREKESLVFEPRKRRSYVLTRRADAIPKPTIWSKPLLETYIALLVYGEVPPHLTNSLYKKQTDHQQTVVSLLMDIFYSQECRKALTPEALAMALTYIQDKKLTFRPAARAIFNQAEINNITLDTRICNLFLKGSAKTGDLDGFDMVLKTMARKRIHADSETWISLLTLVEDVEAKRYILGKMHNKGLNRYESALVKVGRHMAPYELEGSFKQLQSIKEFIDQQDALYTKVWFDAATLSKMVDVLGKNEQHKLCDELLDFTHKLRPAIRPTAITTNTLITHNRDMQTIFKIIQSLETRWPTAKIFDKDTFDMLFQIAWTNRRVNLLRVIWHYASFARQISSKMTDRMHGLLQKDEHSTRLSLLKSWDATIVGEDTLALLKPNHKYTLATAIAWWHGAKSHFYEPAESFGAKLAEAYELDRQLLEKSKAGEPMTTALKESLTVAIPLRRRPHKNLLLVSPPQKTKRRRLQNNEPQEVTEGNKIYLE